MRKLKVSKKPFPKPTNQWLEEDVELEINTPDVDMRTGRMKGIKKKKIKAKERVYYADAPTKQTVCGNHYYEVIDKHKYIFKCKNCNYHRVAPPCTYDLVDGKLVRRSQDK